MYRTSEYQKYSDVYLNTDNTVQLRDKRNYVEYLQDVGDQKMTQIDRDFLASKESLNPLLNDPIKVDQMLLGRKVMKNVNVFFSKNPAILESMNTAVLSQVNQ